MEKLEPSYTADENVKIMQPPRKTVWWFFSKLNIESPYDLEIHS